MKYFRDILLWGGTAFIGVLALLSIIGAFMGASRAQAFFCSWGMLPIWMILGLGCLIAPFLRRTFWKHPGRIAMHLGFTLIILGGAMNTPTGRSLLHQMGLTPKITEGYLFIPQGQTENAIRDGAEPTRVLGTLPFDVTLDQFAVDYYPARPNWRMELIRFDANGEQLPAEKLNWRPGRPTVELPGMDLKVFVWSLLEEPETWSMPLLELSSPQMPNPLFLPASPETSVPLGRDYALTVNRVFRNLQPGKDGDATDRPGPASRPAVELGVASPDKPPVRFMVFARRAPASQPGGMNFTYHPAGQGPARPPHPYRPMRLIAEISIGTDQDARTRWLIIPAGLPAAPIPLKSYFANDAAWRAAGWPTLLVVGEEQPVRQYRSEVTITEGDSGRKKQTIRINQPLSVGSYRLLQQEDYDRDGWSYTVLQVRSGAGLTTAFTGMGLLFGGVVWGLWIAPLLRRVTRREC